MTDLWHYNDKIGIALKKEWGNTNTHIDLARRIVRESVDVSTPPSSDFRFLEPAVGTGSFYLAMLEMLIEAGVKAEDAIENMLYGYDIDPEAIAVLVHTLREKYHYQGNSFKLFVGDFLISPHQERFNYVITNPPYVSAKNIQPPKGMNKKEYLDQIKKEVALDFDNRADLYMMFYLKTLQALKPGGRQVFLCSDSWLDCEYGDDLKTLLSTTYTLKYVVNSSLYAFFRDDTSAVITVIDAHPPGPNEQVMAVSLSKPMVHLKSIYPSFDPHHRATQCQSDWLYSLLSYPEIMSMWQSSQWGNHMISNSRNVLVVHAGKYHRRWRYFSDQQRRNYWKPVSEMFTVSSTSVSQAELAKAGVLIEAKSDNITPLDHPLFWQIQARVNRPPQYKMYLSPSDLVYRVSASELAKDEYKSWRKNIKKTSVYLSGIVDRFPLLFYTDQPSFHVSKYMHLASTDLTSIEMCLALNNVFAHWSMEWDLKEGTRKTLRIGEMGLTKEIKKDDLENLMIIDFRQFSPSSRTRLNELAQIYQKRVIYNIIDALEDKEYQAIQSLICQEVGISNEMYQHIVDELKHLYYYRMRNHEKLKTHLFKT